MAKRTIDIPDAIEAQMDEAFAVKYDTSQQRRPGRPAPVGPVVGNPALTNSVLVGFIVETVIAAEGDKAAIEARKTKQDEIRELFKNTSVGGVKPGDPRPVTPDVPGPGGGR